MLVNPIIFAFGLLFGSFLNVCIFRLPKEESIVFPSSHCPKCGKPIKPWDNIPILSFLILGGRCRYCREKISLRYPFIEFLTGCAFLAASWKAGGSPDFFFYCIYLSLFIVAFFTDLDEQIIPDEVIFVGLLTGLIHQAIRGNLLQAFIAAAAGFSVFFVIAKTGEWWYKKEVLGYGDLKLGAMLGVILGMAGFWNTFMLAYGLGGIITVFLLLLKIKTMKDYVPFGPFLIAGAAATLFWGPKLMLALF